MFKVTWKAPKFSLRYGYTDTLRKNLQRQLRQAARDFIMEAIVRVPVDSGQARGTFLPLAKFLNTSVPISGNTPLPNKNPDTGSYGDRQLLFEFISYKQGEGFKLNIQLFYFWFNDFFSHAYPLGAPTPWGSIEAGWDAFTKYLADVAPERYPQINKFIVVEDIDTNFG